jgi:hypothetical protein
MKENVPKVDRKVVKPGIKIEIMMMINTWDTRMRVLRLKYPSSSGFI